MSNHDYDSLARTAYQSYAKVTGWKDFQGNDLPIFDNLQPEKQDAWVAAVKEVLSVVGSGETSDTVGTYDNVNRAAVG